MQTDWAAENLQTIRTLMERAALYRRALAPLMTAIGLTGIAGAIVGHFINLESPRAFVGFWMGVSVLALAEGFLLVRRQALKDAEPLWSPPTRRVAQAILPAFFAGFAASIPFLFIETSNLLAAWLLVPTWMVLYGCGLHAAGFFMPRGVKFFGWGFVLCGCIFGFLAVYLPQRPLLSCANWSMGAFFGGAHLAYGIYLYFTERSRNAT